MDGKSEVQDSPTIPSQTYTLHNGDNLKMESIHSMELISKEEKDYPFDMKDFVYTYQLNTNDKLILVERILPNKDSFVFLEWENKQESDETTEEEIIFTITFDGATHYNVTGFSLFDIERPHDNTVGVDETTYPNGLLQINTYEKHDRDIMLGKNYLSELLTKEYDNNDISYIRKFIDEIEDYSVHKESDSLVLEFTMTSKQGSISEQWFMISNNELFETEDELMEWIALSNKEFKVVNEWYTAGGVYNKIPWSIEPFDRMGYGKNISFFREAKALNRYRNNSEERYYINLLFNSLANFENYPKNDDHLFEAHYTSTWLKDDYGTTAPYVDTRHNELVAIYQNAVIQELNLDDDSDQLIHYANFLVKQEQLNNVIHVPDSDGYFISDYFDYTPATNSKQTHSSLNHVLGEMNLLLDVYMDSGQEKYLQTAKKIKTAIQETEDDWIRDDFDLWYQVNSNLEYSGRDYPIVTLKDLLMAESKWQSVYNNKEHLFEKLITSKIRYLENEGIELDQTVQGMMQVAGY